MTGGSTFLLVLELLGTFVFALNGALTAMEAEDLDLVGVSVLGTMTALGGGVTRDVLMGAVPPATFEDWRYLAVALAGALLAFVAGHRLTRMMRLIDVFDAAGLGLFCVTGTVAALEHGAGPLQASILGAVTAVGGGTIRDITIRRVPVVLTSELYAVPALAGASLTALAATAEFHTSVSAVVAVLTCFGIRLAAIRFDLHLPRPRLDRAAEPGERRRKPN